MDIHEHEEQDRENPSTPGSRSRTMRALMVLEGVNGLCGLPWPVLWLLIPDRSTPPAPFLGDGAIIIVLTLLSLLHLIVSGGLGMCRLWAFRLGLINTIFTLGIALFLVFVSFELPLVEIGAVCALMVNSVVLWILLQSEVIRTAIAWKQKN